MQDEDAMPQAAGAERSVLAAMMLDQSAIARARALLKAETFYDERLARVFTAITALHDRAEVVDLLTVTNELSRRDDLDVCGGPPFLAEVLEHTGTSKNITVHAGLVLDGSARRRMRHLGVTLLKRIEEPGADIRVLLADIRRECARTETLVARSEMARHAR
jgi:replicative DNA helicase